MGSGKLLLKAQKKYQLSSFTKIILFDYDNFYDMDNKEKELVQLSNCFPQDQMSYNLVSGGRNYETTDSIKTKISQQRHLYFQNLPQEKLDEIRVKSKELWDSRTDEEKERIIEKCRKANLGKNNPMYGHACTEFMTEKQIRKRKENISKSLSGKNNPMYGHACTEFMTEEQIRNWKENISKAVAGEKHPIYGTKMLYDLEGKRHYIKIDKIHHYLNLGWKESKSKNRLDKRNKTHVTYGRKWMHIPNTNIRKLVLNNEIQKYLDLGYIMGSNKK